MSVHFGKPGRGLSTSVAKQPVAVPDAASLEDAGAAGKIAVIGLGYIGLPTAAVLAGAGWPVCGVDISEKVVETINAGRIHIEETDLDGVVSKAVANGGLHASLEVPVAEYYMIAVPTPLGDDRQPGLDYVVSAARSIAPKLVRGACVIIESTSPVGTSEMVANILAEMRPDLAIPRADEEVADIAIAYCPERVLPGKILAELVRNDRVIGGITPACAGRAAALYRSFVAGECVETTARSAEMVKLVENSFRDVNIAFANELSLIAERLNIDVWEIIRLANRHPRVNILQPGPGVGGHCIAVDPWFLVAGAPEQARIIRTAREVNDFKSVHVCQRLEGLLEATPEARIALLGLAFKPDIDDFRESPALEIAEHLAHKFGPRMMVVEPFTDELPGSLADSGACLTAAQEALDNAEIVAVLVDHSAFKAIDQSAFAGKIVYDTRGMLKG